ncbi:hypothetical protein CTAYLR_003414 [Chrysophaeum taylorii]|uniref:FAS1 domain-containing protein n=1 Tax=Chrysophaeum taylorii TaxID=2483200 RepID=A0AAD7U9C0_9STRA|nr:hypothetical protein CTAYLR_003414 [Chrysophaeum taylorii]
MATLSGDGLFTVFAPTNDALDALDEGVLEGLLGDTYALEAILLYHVTSGDVFSTDLVDGQVISMLSGNTTTITISESIMINTANITSADNKASNGVVHIIDAVLFPYGDGDVDCVDSTSWFKNGEPSKDCAWVAKFVPTRCTVKSEDRILAEYACPASYDSTCDDSTSWFKNDEPNKDCPGPFTVFAPTNDAFDKLPNGTLEALLNDTESLTAILLYHVVGGEVYSANLTDGEMIMTLECSNLTVSINDTGAFLIFDSGSAAIISADIEASNGVVHVIDTVLIPGGEDDDDCENSTSWYKLGDTSKDCAWVAEFVPTRCAVKSENQILAEYACPAACKKTCQDSTSWFKNGEPSKDCAWVSVFPEARCDVFGEGKALASDACPTACA